MEGSVFNGILCIACRQVPNEHLAGRSTKIIRREPTNVPAVGFLSMESDYKYDSKAAGRHLTAALMPI